MTTQDNYQTFDHEWEKEANRLPKEAIIKMLAEKGKKLEKAIEALKLAKPYIEDLQSENYEDRTVGMRYDEQLADAFEKIKGLTE